MGIKNYVNKFQAASDKGLWWAGALSSFFATLLSIVLTFGVQELPQFGIRMSRFTRRFDKDNCLNIC